jgi:hypothetical protein
VEKYPIKIEFAPNKIASMLMCCIFRCLLSFIVIMYRSSKFIGSPNSTFYLERLLTKVTPSR